MGFLDRIKKAVGSGKEEKQSKNTEKQISKHDVFISYSTKDSEIANMLCHVLEQNNLKCWIAPRNISSGRNYVDEIADAIKSTKIIVLVFSKFSQESKYSNNEVKLAFSYKKPILSFNIDNSLPKEDMEYYLKVAQWLPAYPNPKDEFETLVRDALKLCNGIMPTLDESLNEEIQQRDLEDSHVNDEIADEPTPNNEIWDFKYLDALIHSGVKKIILESDISLSDDEPLQYKDGIKLDIDDLIIDGNGHTINAGGFSRIFEITGHNIIIKSLTFTNGNNSTQYGNRFYQEWRGGAVYNQGTSTFIDCVFEDNVVGYTVRSAHDLAYYSYRSNGGAIFSNGHCNLISCSFRNNLSKGEKTVTSDVYGKYFSIGCDGIDNHVSNDMTFLNKIKNAFSDILQEYVLEDENNDDISRDVGDFGYLDGLIHQSSTNVVSLSKDIIFSYDEKSGFGDGINLDVDNLVIEGNNHIIDAKGMGKIFNCNAKNIKIKNIAFKNAFCQNSSSVVENDDGEIDFIECIFENNISFSDGLLSNSEGKIDIIDCIFRNNVALGNGGLIINDGSHLKIRNSEIINNLLLDDIISNKSYLHISETNFEDNISKHIIFNDEKSVLGISYGNFINNSNEDPVIYNNGKSCSIDNVTFKNNGNAFDIYNETDLTLEKLKINDDGKTIFNNGKIVVDEDKSLSKIENKIDNHGIFKFKQDFIPENKKHDFSYLDDLIHCSNESKIKLTHDICFEEYETDYYEGGVELDIDGLVIDGDGHTISGAGKSRVFIVTAKDVIIKNVNFKNGISHKNPENLLNSDGGSLRICENANVTLIGCTFFRNSSENNGGAILNNGKLSIKSCILTENMSQYGGAITNNRDLCITNSDLCDNNSHGGAIYNYCGNVLITKTNLNNNSSDDSYGAIFNDLGEITIVDSKFADNCCHQGVIYNNIGKIELSHSYLINNNADNGAVFYNDDGIVQISNSSFSDNAAFKGGACCNAYGSMQLEECTFEGNVAQEGGGAINNEFGELLLEESSFENNKSSESYCDDLYNGGFLTLKNNAFNNSSKTILNKRKLSLIDCSGDMKDVIENNGDFVSIVPLKENQRNFEYLDSLIQNSCGEIILENDIVLDVENGESNKYHNGIRIDRDIVIDGNNHAIDAQYRSKIFDVLGDNVIFKNIKFANAFSKDGGAISNCAELGVYDCDFIGNVSEFGGAIYNDGGKIDVKNSNVCNNESTNEGIIYNKEGKIECKNIVLNANESKSNMIYNDGIFNMDFGEFSKNIVSSVIFYNCRGDAVLSKCNFTGDSSQPNGAIHNNDKLEVIECDFAGFFGLYNGSVIYNDGSVEANGCNFINNSANFSGGAIYNDGTAEAMGCNFINNSARYGGAIENFGFMEIHDCNFEKNSAEEHGGAILNKSRDGLRNRNPIMKIFDSKFEDNNSNIGGAIRNDGKFKLFNCQLNRNSAKEYGGAIIIYNISGFHSKDCTFDSNTPDNIHRIYSFG